MGSGTFIMAVGQVLIDKTFIGAVWRIFRKKILKTRFLDTYLENLAFDTLTYR